MKFILPFMLFIFGFYANAQKVHIAHLSQDGIYVKSELKSTALSISTSRSGFNQIQGFPFAAPAHPNFKNFRNVTIADLNNDDSQEILACLNETLFALESDGTILWQVALDGTSNYPPAVADIDGDGDLEIALQTYGVPSTGNVYLLDHTGTIQDGWPLNIDNNFFLNAVTFADMDENGILEIIASERVNSNEGRVHVLDHNGNVWNANWPVTIPGTPAFTPSIGDLDNNGFQDLVTCTTTALYAFDADGKIKQGFPLEENGAKFSYQSALLADLDEDETLEIITARHGDLPGTAVVNHEGSYHGEWPDYDDIWTFATPAVADIDADGDFEVFYARPYISESNPGDVILGYDHEGNKLADFQVLGQVGSEGVLSIADLDGDGDFEIITASNATIDGMGLIQAYHTETGNAVSNFPLLVPGFTLLNGAYLSDVNNDGKLDLTALSYQLKFDQSNPDTAFINVFDLQVPYDESVILWNGYKGSNRHDGLLKQLPTNVKSVSSGRLEFYPNPVRDFLHFSSDQPFDEHVKIYDSAGNLLMESEIRKGNIDLNNIPAGTYFLKSGDVVKRFIKL